MAVSFFLILNIVFFAMLTPGADMFLIMRYTITQGYAHALMCIVGITTGIAAHISLAATGVGLLLYADAFVLLIIKLMGASYLAFVGWQMLKQKTSLNLSANMPHLHPKQFSQAYLDGLFCNLLNPKVSFLMIAIFTQVLDQSYLKNGYDIASIALLIMLEVVIVWALFARALQLDHIKNMIIRYEQSILTTLTMFFFLLAVIVFILAMRDFWQ